MYTYIYTDIYTEGVYIYIKYTYVSTCRYVQYICKTSGRALPNPNLTVDASALTQVGSRGLGGLLPKAGLLHHGQELLRWEAVEVPGLKLRMMIGSYIGKPYYLP